MLSASRMARFMLNASKVAQSMLSASRTARLMPSESRMARFMPSASRMTRFMPSADSPGIHIPRLPDQKATLEGEQIGLAFQRFRPLTLIVETALF